MQFPLMERSSIKIIDESDADQVRENLLFPTNYLTLSQVLGEVLEPWAWLAPVSFARHLPIQGEARSWEALGASDPKLPFSFFFSCSGKPWVDYWFYETSGFCAEAVDGQPGAQNMRLPCLSGLPQQGFSLHTSRRWKSVSSRDGGPGFLAPLQFSKKRRHNFVFQLLISWFPLPWRQTFVPFNGKGQNVCVFVPN